MRGGLAALCAAGAAAGARLPPSARPAEADRKFRSAAVDAKIAELKPKFKDPAIGVLFENCWPNTLDTTVQAAGANDSFIITGDIPAMWLRDSTNQVLPYVDFAAADASLRDMLRGVVMRQLRSVRLDPYANAFNQKPDGAGGNQKDARKPPMTPGVWEGKYELDSLAAAMKLAARYWDVTGDSSVLGDDWLGAMETILDTCEAQQGSTAEWGSDPPYTVHTRYGETFPGAPADRTGMIRSAFRPSDDRTKYDYLIPSEWMAAAALNDTARVAAGVGSPRAAAIASRAAALAAAVRASAAANGTVDGRYVFEVDGRGGTNEMEDANVPSLLSLPYLGALAKDDAAYLRTRAWLLSDANPYYYSGTVARGIGSPHTPRGNIWPMSITVQALTSTSDAEITECLGYLKASAAATGFMHESFSKDNAGSYTRSWFAWANALFGELILTLVKERPHLVLS